MARVFIFFSLLSCVYSPLLQGQTDSLCQLVIHVEGIKEIKGHLRVAVFNNQKGFPSNSSFALKKLAIPVTASSQTVIFSQLKSELIATGVLHDINSNGRLDKSIIGIPKEPIAVSNNVRIKRGPPSFKDSTFQMKCPKTEIDIILPDHD